MEVLRNAGNSWVVLSVRHVGSLTIVPLVGDSIGDNGCQVDGSHISSGTVGGKVLSVSTATLGPDWGSVNEIENWKRATYMS